MYPIIQSSSDHTPGFWIAIPAIEQQHFHVKQRAAHVRPTICAEAVAMVSGKDRQTCKICPESVLVVVTSLTASASLRILWLLSVPLPFLAVAEAEHIPARVALPTRIIF